MRLVFAGTPEVAVPSLRLLADAGHDIAAVITRPDAPLGRKRVLTPSPVATAAEEMGLRVIRAARLDDEATAAVAALEAELGVIVAYGGLVREPLLSTPSRGWINLHFSLLPRWRGAAPVQHALIAGDTVTGAAVFQLVAALDAGDVYGVREYPVPSGTTAGAVLNDLSRTGGKLLRDVVADIATGAAVAVPQVGKATLAPKLRLEDGRLDWTLPAERVYARFAGVTPEPGAFTTVGGEVVKVLEAGVPDVPLSLPVGDIALDGRSVLIGTGTAAVRVDTVQPAGKRAMAAGDWWRGQRGSGLRAGA